MTVSMDTELLAVLKDFKTEFDFARSTLVANRVDKDGVKDGSKFQKSIKMNPRLEQFLEEISKTGQTLFPWKLVKPVFLVKLDQAMREFHQKDTYSVASKYPNSSNETFDQLYSLVMDSADSFTQAPFTIQRLCELICSPERHYKRVDKYLRALEKNMIVVTTVDEKGCKLSSDHDENMPMLQSQPSSVKLSHLFEWINKTIPRDVIHSPNDGEVKKEEDVQLSNNTKSNGDSLSLGTMSPPPKHHRSRESELDSVSKSLKRTLENDETNSETTICESSSKRSKNADDDSDCVNSMSSESPTLSAVNTENLLNSSNEDDTEGSSEQALESSSNEGISEISDREVGSGDIQDGSKQVETSRQMENASV